MRLKILTTLLVATVATFSSVHAQMKVGDNPNSVAGNAAFQVEKNGKQVLVDTTGKLGIGTLAPTRKLEIYGVAAEPALYLHTSGNDSVSGGQILFRESDPRYGVNLRHYTGNGTINGRANSVEGLYFEGVVNGVSSTTLMVDQNNNRVGLGTNNPSTTLEIDSKTANVSGLKLTSLTSAAPTSTGQAIGVDASGNVVTVAASVASSNSWFNAATNTAATANTQDIYQMGKVSVGAVSATSKFAVVSDGAGSGAADDVEIASYNSSPSIGLFLKSAGGTKAAPANLANGNQLGNIVFQGQAGGSLTDLSGIHATYQGNGTTTLSDLTFKTSNANRMYIGSSGNVGLGTVTPGYTLDIRGNDEMVKISSSSATNRAGLFLSRNGSDVNELLLGVVGVSSQYVLNAVGGDAVVQSRVGNLYLDATATKNVLIAPSGGKVGIGTNAPSTTLDVNGTGRVRTLPAGASGDVLVSADANGNLRNLTIAQLSALGIMTKAFVTPNSGASSGNIPCSAGYDVINYDAADGNYSATITLPNCGSPGQKIVVRSAATFSATINKTNTVGMGTWTVQTGDVYEFTYMNSKWELTASPTKTYSFCAAPNNSSAILTAPSTPKTIMTFGDACWVATVTLPSGGTVGDSYLIQDNATFNLTVSLINTTLASNLVITTGSLVRFVKSPQGWVRDL